MFETVIAASKPRPLPNASCAELLLPPTTSGRPSPLKSPIHTAPSPVGLSPAAVSNAVQFLTRARLLFRERVPGQRADVYRVYDDDVWSTIMAARLPILEEWQAAMRDAAETVGPDTRGGRRLLESEDFFGFMHEETAATLQRWQEHRRRRGEQKRG